MPFAAASNNAGTVRNRVLFPRVAEFAVGVEEHLHPENLHSLKQMFLILITSAYRSEYLKYSDCRVRVAVQE